MEPSGTPVDVYTVIARPADTEIEVQHSRFLTRLRRVGDEESARAVIDSARREHRTARHHCTAFVLGPDAQIMRSNDDGEPAGTAGAPMLEALSGRGVTDVVAVVIRYFGGVKLGTGGLVRAYGDAMTTALDAAGTRTRQRVAYLRVRVGIGEAGRLEHELRADGVQVAGVDYGADLPGPGGTEAGAALTVAVPAAGAGSSAERIAALTAGRAHVEDAGTGWADAP